MEESGNSGGGSRVLLKKAVHVPRVDVHISVGFILHLSRSAAL